MKIYNVGNRTDLPNMRKLFLASYTMRTGELQFTKSQLVAVDVTDDGKLQSHRDKATDLAVEYVRKVYSQSEFISLQVEDTITNELVDDLMLEQLPTIIYHTAEDLPLPNYNLDGTQSRKSREVLCDTGDGEWCIGFYDHADQKWASNDETVTFTKDLKWYDLIPK